MFGYFFQVEIISEGKKQRIIKQGCILQTFQSHKTCAVHISCICVQVFVSGGETHVKMSFLGHFMKTFAYCSYYILTSFFFKASKYISLALRFF